MKYPIKLFLISVLYIFFFIISSVFFNWILSNYTYSCIPFYDVTQKYSPIDFSIPCFILTYGSLLFFVGLSLKKPRAIFLVLCAYSLILLTRSLSVYFITLCPNEDAITLNDPILNNFFYPNGYSPYDLMYSGHVATIFLLALCCEKKFRLIFILVSILVGTMLTLQHVHYSIDILAAYPLTFVCFYGSKKINTSLGVI